MADLEKKAFLEKYKLENVYREDKIAWSVITEIVEDYRNRKEDILEKIRAELMELLNRELKGLYRSTESRTKDPEHLAEKIIRKICIEGNSKYEKIDKNNYYTIISDLVGIRVLLLTKEDWESVHSKIAEIAADSNNHLCLKESKAYIRYGDRDVFQGKIESSYSYKGYRSQHYTFSYGGHLCEVQVRTIAEEVFGEFDHKVRYPYRQENKFLMRYSVLVGQLMSVADELISTCMNMGEQIWDECDSRFEKDNYINVEKRNEPAKEQGVSVAKTADNKKSVVNAKDRANILITRKGEFEHEPGSKK